MSKLVFSSTRRHEIGGLEVVLGRLTREAANTPVVYVAALTEDDLKSPDGHRRGFGPTEADAVARLLQRFW